MGIEIWLLYYKCLDTCLRIKTIVYILKTKLASLIVVLSSVECFKPFWWYWNCLDHCSVVPYTVQLYEAIQNEHGWKRLFKCAVLKIIKNKIQKSENVNHAWSEFCIVILKNE